MRIYRAKTLVDGAVIGESGKYVAVPDKFDGEPFAILWQGELMKVNDWKGEAEHFRTFDDKFNRNKTYTLGYFTFKPKQEL